MLGIIYFGTHFERLPLLRAAYEPYFQTTVYMSPKEDIGRALRANLTEDNEGNCWYWTTDGECEANPEWMARSCGRSCSKMRACASRMAGWLVQLLGQEQARGGP